MTDHVKNQICQRIEELEAEKLELNEQLDALQEERDALAAQLDRPRIKMLGDLIRAGLEPDNILASLARLKAQWMAEAFDHPLIAPDMKAGCIGEFEVEVEHSCTACHFDGPDDDCEVCGGEVTYTRRHDVPWTTQKNIFKAMSAFKAASLRRQAEGGEA